MLRGVAGLLKGFVSAGDGRIPDFLAGLAPGLLAASTEQSSRSRIIMENQGEKRSHSDSVDVLDGVKAVLLDIEGTTTPLSFVTDKVHPYVRENLKTYLENHWDNEECQADVKALRTQVAEDTTAEVEGVVAIPEDAEDNRDAVIEAVVANVVAQMGGDRKAQGIKALQSHMLREAYKTGKVLGEVYEDVATALKTFAADGLKVYTFSSASSDTQKLLFGHTEKGNLSEYISAYFDTELGSKTEKASYTKIAEEAGVSASEMLFLTDLPSEASAASEASFKTSLVVREGNADLSEDDKKTYNTVNSFAELSSDAPPAKRAENEEGNGAAEEDKEEADSAEDEVDDDEADDDEAEADDGVDNGDS